MRIFKGLDNIHSVIDRHEAEWRREQGEDIERRSPESIEENVRRRLAAQPDSDNSRAGRFSADRFFGGKTESEKTKPAKTPKSEPEITAEPEKENEPEAVEIIKNKEGRHSWLYNEVMKAINDAAKDRKNTKIIAVFVPVVQNGKEFEELPADEKITVSPIEEKLAKIEPPAAELSSIPAIIPAAEPEEPSAETFDLIPETTPENDPVLAEAFREMEEKLDENIQQEHEQDKSELPPENDEIPAPDITAEEAAESAELVTPSEDDTDESAILTEDDEIPAPDIIPEEESETEDVTPADDDTDESAILTEDNEIPAPDIDTEDTPEPETLNLSGDEPDREKDIPEDDVLQDGEPMQFEELNAEEITLPDALEDDEVFDETLTEVHRPDDGEETLIIEEGDEIEIKPDPEN